MDEMNSKKILLIAINAKYIHSNLAVYDLKAYSKKYKDNICISEYTINNISEQIIMDIYKKKPEVMAFSVYIWNVEMVLEIICELNKLLPEVPIWLGGPEVSYNAEELLNKYQYVKGILRGEGEETFRLLMEHYIEGLPLSKVTGITYREEYNNQNKLENNILNEDGKNQINIVTAPLTAPVNMGDIPFPYEDIADFENRIIYYESSRGCPYSCSYCLSSVEKSLRFRPVDMVKKELAFFMEKKVPQVKFVDRTFNCKKDHALEIWKFIMENDNGITNFHFEISADIIDDEELELLRKMRPGLVQLEIGVQSTNEKTIKEIRRVMKFERLSEIVCKIKAFKNIHQHLDLIAGLPFEDYESFKKSFNDVYSLHPDQLQLGFLKVLKGSYMKEMEANYGIVHKEKAPYEVMYTDWLSFNDVLRLKQVEEMVENFYNSSQFKYSISWLEKQYDTPFELYEALADYYELNVKTGNKQSRMAKYELLHEMYKDREWSAEFDELLKYDIFLREKAKSRPSFAQLSDENKEDIRRLYKNEFREYDGKVTHIEPFTVDLELMAEQGLIRKEKAYVLFDYSKRDALDYSAATIRI